MVKLVEHDMWRVGRNERHSGARAVQHGQFGQQMVHELRAVAARDDFDERDQVDAVDDDRRVAAVGPPLAVAFDEQAVVVDCGSWRNAADDAQRCGGAGHLPPATSMNAPVV